MYGDQHQYKYMTVDDMKSLGDDSMRMDVTRDEKGDYRNSYGEYLSGEFLSKVKVNIAKICRVTSRLKLVDLLLSDANILLILNGLN